VLYSVAQMMGKREDKNLEQQTTMALIRELQLGASKGTKVLVGKDGERHVLKDDDSGGKIDPQVIFKPSTNCQPVKRRSPRPSRWRRRRELQGQGQQARQARQTGQACRTAKPLDD
jgi:hypothetical protein